MSYYGSTRASGHCIPHCVPRNPRTHRLTMCVTAVPHSEAHSPLSCSAPHHIHIVWSLSCAGGIECHTPRMTYVKKVLPLILPLPHIALFWLSLCSCSAVEMCIGVCTVGVPCPARARALAGDYDRPRAGSFNASRLSYEMDRCIEAQCERGACDESPACSYAA